MKKSDLDKAVEQVVKFKMKAVDNLIEELIKPLEVTDNPEDVIGKPYESWTPQDLEMAKRIYGTKEPSLLSNLVFRKTYERVREMEQEEL